MLHFTIGSSLVSHFTHWLGIHWSFALEIPIGYFYPLESHIGYSYWILLDWNHHHWNNGHTEISTISHWIGHSLACIIGHRLKLTLNLVHEVNYYLLINTHCSMTYMLCTCLLCMCITLVHLLIVVAFHACSAAAVYLLSCSIY